jgi:hypothetical protein
VSWNCVPCAESSFAGAGDAVGDGDADADALGLADALPDGVADTLADVGALVRGDAVGARVPRSVGSPS